MKCPKCSGKLRLVSDGYYRNEIETPMSVTCLNCGFYAEKEQKAVMARPDCTASELAAKILRPVRRVTAFRTYRSIVRDEIDRIYEYKKKKLRWVDIIDLLAKRYPEFVGMKVPSMQKAFSIVHSEVCCERGYNGLLDA